MYHKRHKYDIIIILAVMALGVSLFLAVSEALKISVPCDLTGGCEAVLTSKYSKMLGIPLPYFGIAFFSLIIVGGLLANHYVKFKPLLTWFLGVGAVFSLGFLILQFFTLKSVCQYCLTVDFLTIAMFLWDLNIEHKSI